MTQAKENNWRSILRFIAIVTVITVSLMLIIQNNTLKDDYKKIETKIDFYEKNIDSIMSKLNYERYKFQYAQKKYEDSISRQNKVLDSLKNILQKDEQAIFDYTYNDFDFSYELFAKHFD